MKVFISYRRDDSIVHARLIHNELAVRFGADDVFMDIDDIEAGDDFVRRIDERLDGADVVVAVIGPRWLDLLQRRASGDDYVRHELARALAQRMRVIPVLVGGAAPFAAALPPDLAELPHLNALRLDERALKPHITALVEAVQAQPFEDQVLEHHRRDRTRRLAQWTAASVGVALFVAAWVALFDFAGLDTRLASATMRLAESSRPAPWSGQVVLVGIDERTLAHVGRPFDASWRTEHARLIDKLAAAGARTIAFDLFAEQAGSDDADRALEASIRAAHPTPVVFAVQQMEGNRPLLLPRLAAVAAGGIGCIGEALGYARSSQLAVQRGQLLFPSFALAAYSGGGKVEAFDGDAAELRVRLVRADNSPDVRFSRVQTVRHAQPECEAIRKGDHVALQLFDPGALPALREPPQRLAYERLLAANDAADLASVKGKIVLVGLQLRDRDVMPLPRGGERWGVELFAAQADALVRGAAIRPPGTWATWWMLLASAGLGAFAQRGLAERARWLRTLAMAVAVAAAVAASVVLYRTQGLLLNLAYPVAAYLLAAWVMARLQRARKR
jgi:CHASE2 domain-containing sensor protein